MNITRSGSQPAGKGPDEYFTGMVRVDPLFPAIAPARAVGASVTFEPRPDSVAHAPARSNPDRVGWLRACPARGGPIERFDRET